MFDARSEHSKLLENVDALLAKTAARSCAKKPAGKPSAKSAQLAEMVNSIQVEANAKQGELTVILNEKKAQREAKVAEARHIARVAFNLLTA
jgi:hypothetical protein